MGGYLLDTHRQRVGEAIWFFNEECPICAQNRDPATGGPRYNAVTLAAMQEARDMTSGKIPGKWYHSLEEARKDLDV